MATATATKQKQSTFEEQFILKNVSWETYESLLADHVNSSVPHFTYDQGVLEIVSPSIDHEEANRTLAMVVEVVAEELRINVRNIGSMTLKREELLRGTEPDTSFYIQNVMRVARKAQIDLAVDPPPDLVIEIDVSSSSLNKLSIYDDLGIPEIWRYLPESKQVSILHLTDNNYVERDTSAALPPLTRTALATFVTENRSLLRLDWLGMVRAWVRAQAEGQPAGNR